MASVVLCVLRHFFGGNAGMGIYNPFSEKHVQRVWGKPLEAEQASKWIERTG